MGKPTICICENKGADQLRGNREADQRLCFRYSDSTIPLLLKSKISSFQLFSVLVQVGLCRTWSETQIVGFVTHRLICFTILRLHLLKVMMINRKTHCLSMIALNITRQDRKMSLCVTKPTIWVSDQVRHKPACTSTEYG